MHVPLGAMAMPRCLYIKKRVSAGGMPAGAATPGTRKKLSNTS
jgi:hypothetical protein